MFRGINSILLAVVIICAGWPHGARSEDDIIIETDEQQFKTASEIAKEAGNSAGDATAEEVVAASLVSSSPDADTTVYFTYPDNPKEIPTNKPVRLLIGFRNKGPGDFMVDYLDASLRYPMDFSYIITNFTAVRFSRHVPTQQEATFDYGFYLHEAFASRPFTLNINLHYHDASDKVFVSAVYNDTIQVVELDEGLDSQTFFLYLMFAAAVALLGLLGYQYHNTRSKKRSGVRKATKVNSSGSGSGAVESGTSRSSDVDYDWLPESTLRAINKSPKKSPQQSRSPQQSPSAKKKL